MPERSDRPEEGLDELRERLLGVEDRASVKSWFPRLRQTVARLAESESRLRKLNEELEAEVAAQTIELRRANAELETKNARLEAALDELHSSREALMRSERLAAAAALAGTIAHELNSPLGALISSTVMLRDLANDWVALVTEGDSPFSSEEAAAFGELLAYGARYLSANPERSEPLGARFALEAELAKREAPATAATAESLLDLGLGPDSPLLDKALALPRATAAADIAIEALTAASVAKRAGEKAAEAVRRLQKSVDADGSSP